MCYARNKESNSMLNDLTKYIQQAIKFDRRINLKNKNLIQELKMDYFKLLRRANK